MSSESASNNEAASEIKTMKLYSNVERVFTELKELGIVDNDPIDVNVLCRFDQYHYEGVQAVGDAIPELGLTCDSKVLDIGSGIGGPARYLAHSARCHVTALEMQADLNATSELLCARTGLSELINCVEGNFLDMSWNPEYDAVVSWLVFLHIPDKATLLRKCYEALKPGGKMFVEDYFRHNDFTEDETRILKDAVYCQDVPTREEYERALADAGFVDVKFDDVTERWTNHVSERTAGYIAQRDRHVSVHGEPTFENLAQFYRDVESLFKGGNLGGVRFVVSKPVA